MSIPSSTRRHVWYKPLRMNCVYETEATPSEEGDECIDANADIKRVLCQERVWDWITRRFSTYHETEGKYKCSHVLL